MKVCLIFAGILAISVARTLNTREIQVGLGSERMISYPEKRHCGHEHPENRDVWSWMGYPETPSSSSENPATQIEEPEKPPVAAAPTSTEDGSGTTKTNKKRRGMYF